MSCPQMDCDLRAITVDDSGEFRLWSIGVSERNDNNVAATLQIFSLNSSDKIHTKFSCLLLPFNAQYVTVEYPLRLLPMILSPYID
jgi:hypothetical protein